MLILQSPIVEKKKIQENVFILEIHSPEIASIINPGQFLNIRVSEKSYPLLRRPFSVCDIKNENIVLMFNILGEGTRIMASKSAGDTIDILGPLGKGFNLDGEYETAVIVAGGLGAAPFPFITRKLLNKKQILSFVGGRTSKEIIDYNLINVSKATEDGSTQFKGTVIDLLNSRISDLNTLNIKMFGCGPNLMLKALQEFSMNNNFECEISTECAMACGFGICQGCPIESTKQKEKYLLVCKDGPVFNVKDIVL